MWRAGLPFPVGRKPGVFPINQYQADTLTAKYLISFTMELMWEATQITTEKVTWKHLGSIALGYRLKILKLQ